MNVLDIKSSLASLGKLEIVKQTTSGQASSAMKILGDFNQCMMGLVYFSGSTPWGKHPDDELLHILEGSVNITVLGDTDTSEINLPTGSAFVVPGGLWHKKKSIKGVKLLFVTSQKNNESSYDKDPWL